MSNADLEMPTLEVPGSTTHQRGYLSPPTPNYSNPPTPEGGRSRAGSTEAERDSHYASANHAPRNSAGRSSSSSRTTGACGRRTLFALILFAVMALAYMAYTSYEAFSASPDSQTSPLQSGTVFYSSEEGDALTAEEAQSYDDYWQWLYKNGCASEDTKAMVEELGGYTKSAGFARRMANALRKAEMAKWRDSAIEETKALVLEELSMLGLDTRGQSRKAELALTSTLKLSSRTTAAFCMSILRIMHESVTKRKSPPEPQYEDPDSVAFLIKEAQAGRPDFYKAKPISRDQLSNTQQSRYKILDEDFLQDAIFATFVLPDMRDLLFSKTVVFEGWDAKQDRPSTDQIAVNTEPIVCVRTWLDDRGNKRQYQTATTYSKTTDDTTIDFAWKGIGPKGQTCLLTVVEQEMVGTIRYPRTGHVVNIRSLGQKAFAFSNSRQEALFDIREKTPHLELDKRTTDSSSFVNVSFYEWEIPTIVWPWNFIDVYFGVTPRARSQRPDMDAYIQGLLDLANDAYRDSRIKTRVREYGRKNVAQDGSVEECTDRDRLRDKNDGIWDELDDVRVWSTEGKWYGPDVIAILTAGSYCGCAYIGATNANTQGYLSMGISCATDVGGFPHEMGHLFGARHNVEKDATAEPFVYGHGWLENCNGVSSGTLTLKRTVMSYRASSSGYTCGSANIIESMTGLFSSPNLVVDGDTIGSAPLEDAVRVHNERRFDMAELADDGCFSGDSTVLLRSGERLSMAELRVGDEVMSLGRDGTVVYSSVVAFLDKQTHTSAAQNAQFLEFQVAGGKVIKLTADHLIFIAEVSESISSSDSSFVSRSHAVPAKDVAVGQFLWLQSDDGLGVGPALVTSVKRINGEGLYAPLVTTGIVIVDGVVASCYSHVQSHDLAHLAMTPLRWMAPFFRQEERPDAGIHQFALSLYNTIPNFLRKATFSFRTVQHLLIKTAVPSLSSVLLMCGAYASYACRPCTRMGM